MNVNSRPTPPTPDLEQNLELCFDKPKKDDLPQRAQRKFEIKQEDKILFSALLCALVK
jgi:hypothetical protein